MRVVVVAVVRNRTRWFKSMRETVQNGHLLVWDVVKNYIICGRLWLVLLWLLLMLLLVAVVLAIIVWLGGSRLLGLLGLLSVNGGGTWR